MSLFARIYDSAMKPIENRGLQGIRKKLIEKATQRVLEIGCGTGLNFPFYKPDVVVTAVDPNAIMLQQAQKRVISAKASITLMKGSIEKLPFPDNSFDTVVCTLVLCSVPDIDQAITEIKRVCKPNGTLLFLEHVRVQQPVVGKIQDLLTPAWKRLCDGCCLNRNTHLHIQEAGVEIQDLHFFLNNLIFVLDAKNKKISMNQSVWIECKVLKRYKKG